MDTAEVLLSRKPPDVMMLAWAEREEVGEKILAQRVYFLVDNTARENIYILYCVYLYVNWTRFLTAINIVVLPLKVFKKELMSLCVLDESL